MRIQTLGSAEIIIGQTVLRPESAVGFGLLLYLGMTAGDRVSRARLVELFWPELPETQARHALRQLLYRLRRYGLPLAEGGEELRVEPSVVECDVSMVFAPAWADECDARQAAAVGQFLIDFSPEISVAFSEWLDDLRNRVARRFTEAALRHLRTARRESRWTDVFDWSTRCLDVDPLNEEATYGLAESTAMRGAKVEAVRILDEYSRELGELDGKIGLSTKVLRQRVSEAHGVDRQDGSARLAMVGRDEEVARLVRIVEDTMRGRGGVTWIVGVAGIGKSRLATEVRREAVIRGFASVTIGLHSNDQQRPFAVLSDLVTQLLKMPGALGCSPETLATLRRLVAYQETPPGAETKPREPNVQQYEIREAIADLLGALESEAPLMMFIDDYHNGDASSVPILTDLIERTATSRMLWLLTSRPSTERPPFRLRATVELKPLSEAACRQLVDTTMPNLVDEERQRLTGACVQIAGGNPFFAREVIQFWDRSGGDQRLPTSVSRAVTDRISRLGDMSSRLLQVISLLGSIATIRRITQVMECDVSSLWRGVEELDSLGIVTFSDEDTVFTMHDIWRDEVLKTLRPMLRLALHARIADIIEQEVLKVREVSLFWHAAAHRGDSGEPELAMRLLESCGAYLMTVGLPSESADTMQRALNYCRSDTERLACQRARIFALHAAGHWTKIRHEVSDAISLSARLDPLYDRHDDLELLAIESRFRESFDFAGALAHARACGHDSLASIEHRVSALIIHAAIADNLCANDELTRSYETLLQITHNDQRFLEAQLVASTIFHTSIGSLDEALESSKSLLAHTRARGNMGSLCQALRFSTYPLRIAGDFSTANVNAHEALRISERYRYGQDASICCDILATIALAVDNLPEAGAWVDRAEWWAQRIEAGHLHFSIKLLRAQLDVAVGRTDRILRDMKMNIEDICRLPVVNEGLSWLAVLADYHRIEGNDSELANVLSALEERLPHSINRGRNDNIVASYCRGLIKLGQHLRAAKVLRHFLLETRRDRAENAQLSRLLLEASYS